MTSIMDAGFLWSDAGTRRRNCAGTTVGMMEIKNRRLGKPLISHPDLTVGSCVPFYFCPRSVMLYLLHMGNHPNVTWRGGQDPIVHLVARMTDAVAWAEGEGLRWAFTLSNAALSYCEDHADMAALNKIDWKAVQTNRWGGPNVDSQIKDKKQAEFLMEDRFPWELVRCIGVRSTPVGQRVAGLMVGRNHQPTVKISPSWYY